MRYPAGTRVAPPALSLRGVSKRWHPAARPVLDGVDLDLEPGESMALTGTNGAGKTTLLRIVAGLLTADAGSVRVCGLDLETDRPDYYRAIGFLAAGNTGLYARLKAEDHLQLWCRLALMPRRLRRSTIARTIGTFGLEPLCGRRVDRLSMGQRQRLRLALAFVHEPRLVLLDEPATSLDEQGSTLLGTALDGLKARGGSALVCLPSGFPPPPGTDRTRVLGRGKLESP